MILLVGGEKGGTGKSAIACNLAAVLAIKKCDVMLVDADPQGTASRWINRKLEAYVIMNMASSHPLVNTAFEASEFLQVQQSAFTVLSQNTINDYKVFQDANAEGISVVETQHSKAKTKIQALCDRLYMIF